MFLKKALVIIEICFFSHKDNKTTPHVTAGQGEEVWFSYTHTKEQHASSPTQ